MAKSKAIAAIGLGVLLGCIAAPVAHAQAGTGYVEGYLGFYAPDSDLLSDSVTFGVRAGYQFGDVWGYLIQVGRYTTNDTLPLSGGRDVNLSLWVIDWSAVWSASHGRRRGFQLLFGPGFALTDAAAARLADDRSVPTDDSFTLHAAGAWSIPIFDDFALRPEVRARWFEVSRAIDLEATVAFGWKF